MIIARTIRSKDAVEAADDHDREHFESDQHDAETTPETKVHNTPPATEITPAIIQRISK